MLKQLSQWLLLRKRPEKRKLPFHQHIIRLIECHRNGVEEEAAELFRQIVRSGRRLEAVQALEHLSTIVPGWSAARYELGMAYLRVQNFAAALPCFEDVHRINATHLSSLHHLGICHLRMGAIDQALSVFKRVEKMGPETDGHNYSKNFEAMADCMFGLARKNKGETAQATLEDLYALCCENERRLGPSPWASLYKGAVLFHKGLQEEACSEFEAAAKLADLYDVTKPLHYASAFGCYAMRNIDFVKVHADTPILPEWLPEIRFLEHPHTLSARGPVLLFSCDKGYFSRFSPTLLKTLAHSVSAGTIVCHFHIIDADAQCDEYIRLGQNIVASNPNVCLNFSFETALGFSHKTYYAISRFLRLPEFLKAYDSAIIVGDCDSAVATDISQVFNLLESHDVGLYSNKPDGSFYKYPWNVVGAGYAYFRNTPYGIGFSKTLSSYIGALFDPSSQKQWWIDQAALFCVMQYYESRVQGFILSNLRESSLPQPFLWNKVGQKKEDFVDWAEDLLAKGEWPPKEV